MKKFWIVGIVLVVWSCKTSAPLAQVEAVDYSNYQEDLGARLPDFPDYAQAVQEATPVLSSSSQAVDRRLGQLFRKNQEKAKEEPYFSGFTVLVYSGIDRNEAFKTKDELALQFPELTSEMQYEQPRYLVKVGSYAYKIETQSIYSKLKPVFAAARIIQDRFLRKEYTISTSSTPNAKGKN